MQSISAKSDAHKVALQYLHQLQTDAPSAALRARNDSLAAEHEAAKLRVAARRAGRLARRAAR